MNLFLKLKHWQLFLLLFGIPFIFQFIFAAQIFISQDPTIIFTTFPFLIMFFTLVYFGWFYAMGTNLHKKLPETVKMNLTMFKWFLIIPSVYIIVMCFLLFGLFKNIAEGGQPNPVIFIYILPLHFFSMFCIFYCLYFNAKSFKSVELQRPVTFNDYSGEFFLIWFFPIGVWFIQPRLNQLFGGNSISELGK